MDEKVGAAHSQGEAVPPFDAVLFASYGTSREDARAASIAPVAARLREGLGCAEPSGGEAPRFAEAYTSEKARRLLARRGVEVPDVSEALHALARSGARRVLVQPGHLVHGTTFEQVEQAVDACRFLFARLVLAAPLLSSDDDLSVVAAALSERHPRRAGELLVFVAHGVEEGGVPASSVCAALGLHLRELGRDDVLVGSMLGYPALDVCRKLVAAERERLGIERVRLVPLMLTAAAHASRDIAGDREGSWRRGFEADGFEVACDLEGLGSLPAVRELYLRHAQAAWAHAEEAAGAPHADGASVSAAPVPAASAAPRFPLFVDLSGACCLVVGLGTVGLRRARMLASFGARVRALDPAPREQDLREAERLGVEVEQREWRPTDLEGVRLVVAATTRESVNAVIARACTRAGIPVSVSDSAERSTFFFPAICRSERLVAGVVSDGSSHELTARAAAAIRVTLGTIDPGRS